MYYTYLISDSSRKIIHAGWCQDVVKMVKFYNKLNEMTLELDTDKKINTLVYLEENSSKEQAIQRLDFFTKLPLEQKKSEIVAVNPDWIDLTLAGNFNF